MSAFDLMDTDWGRESAGGTASITHVMLCDAM